MERERYRIGDLTVDADAVSVTRGDERIELPRLTFDLLLALVRRAPAVASFDDLVGDVWDGAAIADETLTQRVALLRRALGDDARQPRYVRSLRGRGYQLVVAIEPLSAAAERSAAPSPWRRYRRRLAVALGLLLLAFAAVLVLRLLQPAASPVPPGDEAQALVTRAAGADELMGRAAEYLRRHRRRDNDLAVELYQRALDLQPRDPRALAGLSLALGQRRTKFASDPADALRAEELARRALALDASSAAAHQALGLALDGQGRVAPALDAYLRAVELDPERPGALASAAYLLQVQGRLADALEADLRAAGTGDAPPYLEVQIASTLALLDFEPAAAVWFERALELRPDSVFAAASFARLRLGQMRLDEADDVAVDALTRGIRRAELETVRGDVALLHGDAGAAAAAYGRALALDPRNLAARSRSLVLALRRDPAAGEPRRRMDDLVTELRSARSVGETWPGGAVDEAVLLTALDRPGAALAALDVAIGLGFRDAEALLADPMLRPLRSRPGFADRVETIRLRVEAERQRVLAAPWLPPSLLDGRAERM